MEKPIDFWIYQEIVFDIKPDLIIEIGLHRGGRTLALAQSLDRNENGRIIGIDLSLSLIDEQVRKHDRILLIEGTLSNCFKRSINSSLQIQLSSLLRTVHTNMKTPLQY